MFVELFRIVDGMTVRTLSFEYKDLAMQNNETNEYLKTMGTIALSLLLMATMLGMVCYRVFE